MQFGPFDSFKSVPSYAFDFIFPSNIEKSLSTFTPFSSLSLAPPSTTTLAGKLAGKHPKTEQNLHQQDNII